MHQKKNTTDLVVEIHAPFRKTFKICELILQVNIASLKRLGNMYRHFLTIIWCATFCMIMGVCWVMLPVK